LVVGSKKRCEKVKTKGGGGKRKLGGDKKRGGRNQKGYQGGIIKVGRMLLKSEMESEDWGLVSSKGESFVEKGVGH